MAKVVSTGIRGLDELLSGGLQPGSCNLVEGVPGTGKTTVGVQFVYTGAPFDVPAMRAQHGQLYERVDPMSRPPTQGSR